MNQTTIQAIVDAVVNQIRREQSLKPNKVSEYGQVQADSSIEVEGVDIGPYQTYRHVDELASGDYVMVDNYYTRRPPIVTGVLQPSTRPKLGIPVHTFKPSDESVTSSTALQDDNDFVFAVQSGLTYELILNIIYVGVSSTTLGGLNWGFNLPSSTAFYGGQINAPYMPEMAGAKSTILTYAQNVGSTSSVTSGSGGFNSGSWTGSANEGNMLIIKARIIPGATGNVAFRWAQWGSSATPMTIRAGSWATLTRLA